MNGAPDLDTVLDVCGHKQRRIVLATLENQQRSLSIDDLTNEIIKHNHHVPMTETGDETVTRIHVGLQHTHLPKLDEAGLIQYDPERKVVKPTDQIGREGTFLSAILAMDSDLPGTYRKV